MGGSRRTAALSSAEHLQPQLQVLDKTRQDSHTEKDEGRVRAKEVEECAYAFFAREVCDAKVTYETAPTKPATTQAPTVVDEATIISPEIATNAPNAGENSASDRPHRQTTKKSNQ